MAKIYGVYYEGAIHRFNDWETCQKAIDSMSGFIVRALKTELEFNEWADAQRRWRKKYDGNPLVYTAFVDGSVKDVAGEAIPAYGVAIFDPLQNLVHESCGIVKDAKQASTRNEAGELQAAQIAASWAKEQVVQILIVYDYEGICSYISGTWEAKSEGAKQYVEAMTEYEKYIHGMQWIKGHGKGGDFLTRGNALADRLAGSAFDEYSTR